MKATILSHQRVPDGAAVEIHRFMYVLEDGMTVPHAETISLRTARVLAAELSDGNAFVQMLHVMIRSEPADYDTLIGLSFTDHIHPLDEQKRQSEKEE